MRANPGTARLELEEAERHLAEAERAIGRAVRVLGEPLRGAAEDAQTEAQFLLRRVDRFLAHLRRSP